jgi:GrpB-like predicted nucleotidyltransferase (UPF0157 family)
VSNPDEPIENEFLIGGNERRAIVLVDYDPSWPVRFQDERAKITAALGTEAIGIEHIGSTAVPGLAAKPIIDVLVTVADIEDEPRYLPALQGALLRSTGEQSGHWVWAHPWAQTVHGCPTLTDTGQQQRSPTPCSDSTG